MTTDGRDGLSTPVAPHRRVHSPSDCLWWDTLPTPVDAREPLTGDAEADVAIVGAGYTGLWTAHYLSSLDPKLGIVVLEREIAGFGASGRNGGWCSALFATSYSRIAKEHGVQSGARDAQGHVRCRGRGRPSGSGSRHRLPLREGRHGLGGQVRGTAATRTARVGRCTRARDSTKTTSAWSVRPTRRRELGATRVLGALVNPHCAAIHPFRLARGLGDAVERGSVKIYESTPVDAISPHRAITRGGTVRATVRRKSDRRLYAGAEGSSQIGGARVLA